MTSLKLLLGQSLSGKTKNELIEILKDLNENLGDTYNDISDTPISELSKFKREELIAIIGKFNENYDPAWEALAKQNQELMEGAMKTTEDQMGGLRASGAGDSDLKQELGKLDFASMISGPLNACVTAQTDASLATVKFIKEVGFNDKGALKMVDFSYQKGGETEKTELKVPFLSILSIPSLRIDTCTIDFNVKLNSVYTEEVKDEFKSEVGGRAGWGPVRFEVSAAYKKSSAVGVKVEKEFNLGVKVVATNDEMPAGLERVLGILGN